MSLSRHALCPGLLWLSLLCGCGSSSNNTNGTRGAGGGSSNGGTGNTPGVGGSANTGATGPSLGGGGAVGTGATGSGSGGTTGNVGGSTGIAGNGGVMLGVGGGGIAPSGETTCDGIDDDGNGIIDDVDVGGDGVCDCLNIATIGRLGLWSTGTGIFTTWIGARSPLGVTALDNQDLTTVNLAQFQVIVVLNVVSYDWKGFGGKGEMGVASHQYSAAESDALASWVRNGGGLLTTIGYTTKTVEPADINRLLTSLDVGYDTVGVWNVDGFITNWAPHPVTQGILKIKTDVGAGPDIVLHPSLTPIAWDPTNTITLAVEEFGSGHIAMWGDEWITYDSEWKNLTDEQVERLWLNLFSWLSPANQCQVPIPPTVF